MDAFNAIAIALVALQIIAIGVHQWQIVKLREIKAATDKQRDQLTNPDHYTICGPNGITMVPLDDEAKELFARLQNERLLLAKHSMKDEITHLEQRRLNRMAEPE